MLTVKWKDSAQIDLAEIIGYVEQYNQNAAIKLKSLIEATAESLAEMPYKFPRGRVPNTREVVVNPNYIVVYCITSEHIDIVSVLHARQAYP